MEYKPKAALFDHLNNDCKVHILSLLSSEDIIRLQFAVETVVVFVPMNPSIK